MGSSECRLYPLGERALVLETGLGADLIGQRRVWWLAQRLREQGGGERLEEIVPGMNNLTLVFDPEVTDPTSLGLWLTELWRQGEELDYRPREREIPVHYGGEWGPDLEEAARHCGLTPAELVAGHSGGDYRVYFLGFQPGFAYLGGLAPALAVPRRREPRLKVPAGSVGIGGAQTGIYPAASPGGWQLIGRTDLTLFDPRRDEPSYLLPGDRVRFVPLGGSPC
ncbi:5-oxoprolinase subunit PxpB [Aeromonas bivalvium]|uniref:5-oxoprolinase subunit PxpB n=1 Tax=Aeromonas bivalvium TaxID=440079 RepID=A0ABW9GMJ0_9GAMM|nr:5-oxoprolinase subunit PxpB [Aeromonas bivalvium]